MLLNEIAKETGMTKRAVKYYEEKGLCIKTATVIVTTPRRTWRH